MGIFWSIIFPTNGDFKLRTSLAAAFPIARQISFVPRPQTYYLINTTRIPLPVEERRQTNNAIILKHYNESNRRGGDARRDVG